MKQLHELAFIVEGGCQVGTILGNGMKTPKGQLAKIVDNLEFIRLISENRVQYFQLEAGQPIIRYTDEELRQLKKEPLYGQEYFDNDIKFNNESFRTKSSLGISILAYQEMLNTPSITAALCKRDQFSDEELKRYKKETSGSLIRSADNFYLTVVNPFNLLSFLAKPNIEYSINFDLMMNTNNIVYSMYKLFVRNVDPNVARGFAFRCIQLGLNRHFNS